AARRQGAGADPRARPRAPGRRPGSRPDRARAPHHARAGSRGHRPRRGRRGRDRRDAGPVGGAVRSAIGWGGLGVLLLLVAGTFDAEPLYVTGAALLLLGGGSAAWIASGAWGVAIHRSVAKRSVSEEEPLTVRIEATAG